MINNIYYTIIINMIFYCKKYYSALPIPPITQFLARMQLGNYNCDLHHYGTLVVFIIQAAISHNNVL